MPVSGIIYEWQNIRKTTLLHEKPMKTDRRTFLAGTALGILGGTMPGQAKAEDPRKQLPDWEEGFLDIHHISTGRGNAAYIICPDGTTMMIDVGDLGEERPSETMMPHVPDESRSPAEWIVEYIRRFSKPLGQSAPTLDYVFLTHFHSDHIGCKEPGTPEAHGFALSGISMLAEHVTIGKIVDRGFPDYDYPSREAAKRSNGRFFDDYLKFVDFQRTERKTVFEGFDVGSRSQFVLRRKPETYKSFRIQNLYVNGEIWTGRGMEKETLIPKSAKPDENTCSGALEISYGDFRYFSGGDIPGFGKRDVETALTNVVGKTDVLNLNHHGYKDSINAAFLAALKPRVMVVPVWDRHHPHVETLTRMTDTNIYPDRRSIWPTGMFPALKTNLGDGVSAFKPDGHVVVRVDRDGKNFTVFVLNARSTLFDIIHSEIFTL